MGELSLRAGLLSRGVIGPEKCNSSHKRIKEDRNLVTSMFFIANLCPALCYPMDCSTPGSLVLHYLPEFARTHAHDLVMLFNHLILCHPLLFLPSIFPSIRLFSSELTLCTRWPNYWSFSFSISLSNEYSELISFRIDWFDLLAVQETLKSLL